MAKANSNSAHRIESKWRASKMPERLANHMKSAIILHAMANPQRLSILERLLKKEFSVNELAADLGMTQSALSQHLRRLRDAKLVKVRRQGQASYYRCRSALAKEIMILLHNEALGGDQNPID